MSPYSYLVILLSILKALNFQRVNHCPHMYRYNPDRSTPGRWFGTVILTYESELNGVWLRLRFDRPVIQLGNWFGQIKTEDHLEFRLADRNFKLKTNEPKEVLFFITYNQNEPIPELVRITLNGRVLCPIGGEVTTTTLVPGLGEPITSDVLTLGSGGGASFTQRTTPFYRPTTRPSRRTTTTESENESDDEFFQGDLSGSRPSLTVPSRENTNDICGTVIARPKPLITHGDLTHEGEFPWHAAIYHSKGVNLVYICGASLINKEYLVTAAHCVTKPRTEIPSKIGSMVVYLGKHYLKEWSTKGIQDKRVARLVVHPEFESESFKNDIALIKLSEPVTISNYVRPVCLWEDAVELRHIVNQPDGILKYSSVHCIPLRVIRECLGVEIVASLRCTWCDRRVPCRTKQCCLALPSGTIIGWGYDEDGVITDELHKATMPVVTTEACIYSYPDFYARFTSNTTFCAGYRNGTSACNGDSGSGMVFQKTRPRTNTQVWQLRGIVSLSVALQNEARCNTSHYVVFTDLAKHLNWIKSVIEASRNNVNNNYFGQNSNRGRNVNNYNI